MNDKKELIFLNPYSNLIRDIVAPGQGAARKFGGVIEMKKPVRRSLRIALCLTKSGDYTQCKNSYRQTFVPPV